MSTAVLCVVSLGPFFLSLIMGFLALILVSISKEDFD
jgi:hypothetical protein